MQQKNHKEAIKLTQVEHFYQTTDLHSQNVNVLEGQGGESKRGREGRSGEEGGGEEREGREGV